MMTPQDDGSDTEESKPIVKSKPLLTAFIPEKWASGMLK
jgi:hypothetical protein